MTDSGSAITRLRAGWMRWWFAPAAPDNLGLCRALFLGGVLLYFLRHDFSAFGEPVPDPFWRPVWVYRRLLPLRPPGQDLVAVLQTVWKASLLLGCVGLLTRLSTFVAFALGLYLIGLPYNYGTLSHMTAATVFILGILALSRSGDAYSLDRLIARRRSRDATASNPLPPSGEYTWPIRLVWVLLSLIFFAAGVAKPRHSGMAWMTADHLQQFLLASHYPQWRGTPPPLTDLGLVIARYPLLCKFLAVSTVIVELGYPLALFSVRLRWLLVTSMVLMLVGIRLTMGPPFDLVIWCHLFWVPWDWVARRLGRGAAWSANTGAGGEAPPSLSPG